MLRHRAKTVFVDTLALGPSEVRGEDHARSLLDRVLNRRQRGGYARVVINLAIFDGNVEVDADEDAFATKIKIFDRKFSHKKAQKSQKKKTKYKALRLITDLYLRCT
jgi:predicted GNAT superfamily acetyltransferase